MARTQLALLWLATEWRHRSLTTVSSVFASSNEKQRIARHASLPSESRRPSCRPPKRRTATAMSIGAFAGASESDCLPSGALPSGHAPAARSKSTRSSCLVTTASAKGRSPLDWLFMRRLGSAFASSSTLRQAVQPGYLFIMALPSGVHPSASTASGDARDRRSVASRWQSPFVAARATRSRSFLDDGRFVPPPPPDALLPDAPSPSVRSARSCGRSLPSSVGSSSS